MRHLPLRTLLASAALAILAALVAPACRAQTSLQEKALNDAGHDDEAKVGLTRGGFIVAPIPISNPTLGTGLALSAGYLFTADPGSDPSHIGAIGFGTDNDSKGYALASRLEFAGGRWNANLALGEAELNYDLFALGSSFPIEQTGSFGRFGAAYGLTDAFSLGLDLTYIESDLGVGGADLPKDVRRDFGISTGTADLVVTFDQRDDTLYPTSGAEATLKAGVGTVFGGRADEFVRSVAQYRFYLPVFDNAVVAGLLTGCGVSDDTPFYLSCLLGSTDRFRGYAATEHLGDRLASAQVELRGRIGGRFGYALFGGAGRVGDDLSELGGAATLVSAGAGLRLRLSHEFPVDFAVDVAVNGDGETTTYVYVGQRF